MSSAASVVIPACNEEAHIGDLLRSLAAAAASRPIKVVVVCNGCTDRTESIARSFDGVDVLVLDSAAKHVALDAGDDAAGDAFPRFYADADIRIDARSVGALLDALATDEPKAAGPKIRYDLSQSPWVVASFFRTAERLPFNEFWQASHLQGRGIYGSNRAGRARFERFPAIRSDDGFFDMIFDDDERVIVEDAVVDVRCPTSVAQLLRNETRVVEGHRELVAWMHANLPGRPTGFEGEEGRGWLDVGLWRRSAFLRGLRDWPTLLDGVGYAAIAGLTHGSALIQRSLGYEIRWR